MNWISDHFQIVILVLFALGSLAKTLIEKAVAKKNEETWTNEDREEVPLDDDKSYRKSLPPAMPTERRASVPPPLAPRQVIPANLQLEGYEAASAREAAAALKHQQDLAERLRQIRATKATTTGGAAATRARIASKGAAKATRPVPHTLRGRLRDPAEVRRAFVLREVLGPPVGLR